MTPESLEAILVERDGLANDLVERVLTSIQSGTKSQTLLVGPRGIGKTHLVALTYYRVKSRLKEAPELNEKVCIAWLREDEYGVVSWLDLLIRLFRALEEEHPGTTPRAELDALFEMPTQEAERQAQKLLLSYLNGRTLWLLVENLNAIFDDMKESGQRKWRAFWQEHPVFTTLATSPTLFKGISSRTAPFYGFFAIEPLDPLDTEGAAHLLARIAQFRGDTELADFLETPTGRARVRAVHHLAGGNFRVYVVFAAFLSRQSLDELVPPILQLLDELTPYYQSHLMLLSGQQRKIVEVLCDHRGAMPVKTLATRGFMTSQTASSQLADLKERGYVIAHTWGRESFYELREPLMRLCLEVKKHRGEPIAIFVEFLRLWHSRNELRERLEVCPPEFPFERESLLQALAKAELETVEPHITASVTELKRAIDADDYEKGLSIARDMTEIRGAADDWYSLGLCLRHIGRLHESIDAYSRAIEINPTKAAFWAGRGVALTLLDEDCNEEALVNFQEAVSLNPSSDNLANLGMVLTVLERYKEALLVINRALRKHDRHKVALLVKGAAQHGLGLLDEALETWRQIEESDDSSYVWPAIADVLIDLGRLEEASTYLEELSKIHQDEYFVQALLSLLSLRTQRFDLALFAANRALEMGDEEEISVRFNRVQAMIALGQWNECLSELHELIPKSLPDQEMLSQRTFGLLQSIFASFNQSVLEKDIEDEIAKLCYVFDDSNQLVYLATGLANVGTEIVNLCLVDINSNEPSKRESSVATTVALNWAKLWTKALAPFDSVVNVGHWIETAVSVASSGDERILLNLPSEERQLVLKMLEGGGYCTSTPNEREMLVSQKRVGATTKTTKPKSFRSKDAKNKP